MQPKTWCRCILISSTKLAPCQVQSDYRSTKTYIYILTHLEKPQLHLKTLNCTLRHLKQELDNMVKNKIIRKITEPTDWVSSLAYSHKKDGSLRICLDPRHYNTALRRPHHAALIIEKITINFTGSNIFSTLDAKAGYWSIHLDTESQLLTTFQSPYGRYCFQRLPFELWVSSWCNG